MVHWVAFINVERKLGAIMLIGAKNNHNHYFILFYLSEKNLKIILTSENKLIFLQIIKCNILFYKFPKYEIIS
jgi:hypothetical protein